MVGRELRFPDSSTHSPGHYCTRRSWAWTLAFSMRISFLELAHKLGDTTNWVVAYKNTRIYVLTVLEARSPKSRCGQSWLRLAQRENLLQASLSLWSFWRSLGSLSLWTHCPMWASIIPASLRLFLSSYKDTGHWYRAHPNLG